MDEVILGRVDELQSAPIAASAWGVGEVDQRVFGPQCQQFAVDEDPRPRIEEDVGPFFDFQRDAGRNDQLARNPIGPVLHDPERVSGQRAGGNRRARSGRLVIDVEEGLFQQIARAVGPVVCFDRDAIDTGRQGDTVQVTRLWRAVGDQFGIEADVAAAGTGLMDLDGQDIGAVDERRRIDRVREELLFLRHGGEGRRNGLVTGSGRHVVAEHLLAVEIDHGSVVSQQIQGQGGILRGVGHLEVMAEVGGDVLLNACRH